MNQNHPALLAARNSWRCVTEKSRDGWLNAMADDVVIEDPIGMAPTNPSGEGIQGKQAVAAFWDQHIAPSKIEFEIHESFAAGSESAHVLTITTALPNGIRMKVHGIFTYHLNTSGQLRALRGYWQLEDAKVEKPGG